MKYIVILGDGMADYPLQELDGKTPLQYASLPTFDYMARHGMLGMAKTLPDHMPPGSDTANLSVLGYDPATCYSGRSPFEAAGMGVKMEDGQISFRCNLVTLSEEKDFESRTMVDYCAGEIATAEAKELIETAASHFSTGSIKFYPGISYRHLVIWEGGPAAWRLTPPHDIMGKRIEPYLPKGEGAHVIGKMMSRSAGFLQDHPVNRNRVARGLNPANSLWIWGEGKKPRLEKFYEKYRLNGAVISAVDLLKGIAIYAGLDVIEVEGATGNLETNYRGKAEAALSALAAGKDFVYIHIEAPDECSHRFEIQNKVKAMELIDRDIAAVIREELERRGEPYKMMVLPDHATPLSLRTHTHDPVPFVIYRSSDTKEKPDRTYDEISASQTGLYIEEGHRLMDLFLRDLIPGVIGLD